MFLTFYELSADATIFEWLIWFVIHVMMQIITAIAFVLLLIFTAAKQVFAFFHGRKAFNYRQNARSFSSATALLFFSGMGAYIGTTYWTMLPSENQHVGWFLVFPLILTCAFFGFLAIKTMATVWKQQPHQVNRTFS